ncbi:SseB family protein [Microbacterium sp. VKM Ac-2870]|uniref:SseB family protein n=1 Tax=Microbacterium sp. VKM Ac-2870 TaxID=2783825 RepID=UPI00188CF76E|nr:SseB family protein [Microbacterium sp. VKM Ac-2870]MBF4561518.1 SseB family protein [Microbacterium sp. VKM Ac-2870]
MALFSRRGSSDQPDQVPASGAESDPGEQVAVESVPHVGISVSTFGDHSAASTPAGSVAAERPPATAPESREIVPGLVDNGLLKAALAALSDDPQSTEIMNVMRQAMQGQLFLRAQGDVQALLAAGEQINLAIAALEGKRFLLAFSGGAALQASVDSENGASTSVIGQPAIEVLRNAVSSGYDGIYLDHASAGARLILPAPLIGRAVEEAEPTFEIKTLLSAPRDESTAARVADALSRVPVWVAGGADAEGRMGLAEVRAPDGQRRMEVFSHPLEVVALGRGDSPLPLQPEQLGRALASEPGLTGVVVDPGGPWIELDRDALAGVIALAAD